LQQLARYKGDTALARLVVRDEARNDDATGDETAATFQPTCVAVSDDVSTVRLALSDGGRRRLRPRWLSSSTTGVSAAAAEDDNDADDDDDCALTVVRVVDVCLSIGPSPTFFRLFGATTASSYSKTNPLADHLSSQADSLALWSAQRTTSAARRWVLSSLALRFVRLDAHCHTDRNVVTRLPLVSICQGRGYATATNNTRGGLCVCVCV
jgi:hypothetical protein